MSLFDLFTVRNKIEKLCDIFNIIILILCLYFEVIFLVNLIFSTKIATDFNRIDNIAPDIFTTPFFSSEKTS